MNSKQRRKHRRKIEHDMNKPKDADWFHKWKNDKRCIDARAKTRISIPSFEHCGSGNGGYVMLICDGCPEFNFDE